MRVAVNGWFILSPATGTGQYLRHLIEASARLAKDAGVELHLIAPCAGTGFPIGLDVKPPRLSGDLGKVEFEHVTFPSSSRQGHFAVAHVPHFGPPLFPLIPTVVTVHDLIPLVLPEYRGSLAVRLYTGLAAAGARRAKILIADSEASRRDIVARLHISPDNVRVIYLAADSSLRPVGDPEEIARVRVKYHLPDNFILYLGGFDLRKNVRILIEAFKSLEPEREKGYKLVMAGRLPGESPLFPNPRIGAGADVLFIGNIEEEDKPALYSSARLLAYPSRYEGFGLPPLEAMACGTPVVCAKTSSLPEIVGDGGVLLDPLDVRAWVEAIRELINEEGRWGEQKRRGLAQAARFSWERTARETFDVYWQVAGDRERPGSGVPFVN